MKKTRFLLLASLLCACVFHATGAETYETSTVDYGQTTATTTMDLIWSFTLNSSGGTTYAIITGVKNANGTANPSGALTVPTSVVKSDTGAGYIVKKIDDGAFANQIGLTAISIPVTIQEIGTGVFAGCTVLSEITVVEGNPWFTSVDGVLYDKDRTALIACPATAESLSLPSSLTALAATSCANCHRLTSVTIPASVATIGSQAFTGCTLLESLTFKGNAPTADTTICDDPDDITIYKEATSTGWDVSPWTSFKEIRNTTAEASSKVMTDYSGQVTWCYRVVDGGAELYNNGDAVIPAGTTQTFSKDPESGEYIGDGTLKLPTSLGGYPVTRIGVRAFTGCAAVTSLVIPSTVTLIDDYAFEKCSGLEEITLPASLMELGTAPFSGSNLAALVLPANLHTLRGNPVAGCLNLDTITVAAKNRYFTSVNNVLYNRKQTRLYGTQSFVESLTVPASVEWVASNAFSRCSLLTKVTYLGDAPVLDDKGYALYADVDADLISYAAEGTKGWDGTPSTILPASGRWPLSGPNTRRIVSYNPSGPVDPESEIKVSGDWRYRIVDGGAEIWNNGETAYLPETAPTTITVPTTLDGLAVAKIGAGALANFSAVTAITIPTAVDAIDAASITNLPVLASFAVDAGNPHYASSTEGALYDKDFATLLRVPATCEELNVPATITRFAANAFAGAFRLKALTFNAGAPACDDAAPFADCHADFVSLVPYGVTSFGTVPGTWMSKPTKNWGTKPSKEGDVITFTDSSESVWTLKVLANKGVEIVGIEPKPTGSFAIPDSFESDYGTLIVKSIGSRFLTDATGLLAVSFPNTVTNIGDDAFANCDVLASVTLANGLRSIGRHVFSGTAIETISLPDTVNTIDGNILAGCNPSTSIAVGNSNPYFAVSTEGALYDKDFTTLFAVPMLTEEISIPATVTDFAEECFLNCLRLKKVTFAGNAPTVADGDDLYVDAHTTMTNFVAAGNTTFGTLPGIWHLRPVVEIDEEPEEESPFKYRIVGGSYAEIYNAGEAAIDPLTAGAITVPEKLGGYLVKKIGVGAFTNCVNIESITLPDTITEIGDYAFYGCEALESIDLPDSLVTIGQLPFYATGITSINLPSKVKNLNGNPVAGCEWIDTITVDGKNRYFSASDGVLYNNKKTLLIACQAYAEEVTVPKTVTQIGTNAFSSCYDLLTVNFEGNAPSCDDDLYIDCDDVTSYVRDDATGFTIDTWKGRPIITISEILTDGTWYYTLDADGYATLQNNGKCALVNPSGTTTLTLPTTIDGHVVIGLGDKAVSGLKGITTVSIPDTYDFIGDGAFSNDTALASATIGNGVTEIGHWPFYGTKITSLTIPDSVTAIDGNPGAGASLLAEITTAETQPYFTSNDGLLYDKGMTTLLACPATKTSINMPSSVTTIADDAFYGCNLIAGGETKSGDIIWSYSTDGSKTTITSVEGASGVVTIPATLGGLPVTGIDSAALNGCTGITEFVSLSASFSAKNKCLYSADGTILVRVPDTIVLPHTIKTTDKSFKTTKTSFFNPLGIVITTNEIPISTSFQHIPGDIDFATLLNDVVIIRNFAFFSCNVFANSEVPTTSEYTYSPTFLDGASMSVVSEFHSVLTTHETKLILPASIRKVEPLALANSGVTYDGELPYLTVDSYPYTVEVNALNAANAIALAGAEFFPLASPYPELVSDAQYRSYFTLNAVPVSGKTGVYSVTATLDKAAIEYTRSQTQMAAKIADVAAGTTDSVTLNVKPGLYYSIYSSATASGSFGLVDSRLATGSELNLLMTRPSSSSGFYYLDVTVTNPQN